jgi:hypothetical protein
MSRDKTIIPTNLVSTEDRRDLLCEQKLVLTFGVWANPYIGSIGVLRPALVGVMGEVAGIEAAKVKTALEDLEVRDAIVWDRQTAEIYAVGLLRTHVFRGIGKTIAAREFAKIESKKIRAAVAREAPWLAIAKAEKRKTAENQTVSPPTPINHHPPPISPPTGGRDGCVAAFSAGVSPDPRRREKIEAIKEFRRVGGEP